MHKQKQISIKTLVYILPDKNAGVASVVRNLLQFKTGNFRTKVILLHNTSGNEKVRITSALNCDNLVKIVYKDHWNNKFSILKKIRDELSDDSILIVNDGGISLDVIGLFKLKIPVVYIMHGDLDHYYKVLASKSEFIGKIITISDFLCEKLSGQNLKMPIESIKFPVPNVPNLERIVSEKIRLVFVGSLIKTKGVYSLIEIVNCLESNNVDYTLNIIGQGREESTMRQLLESNKNVHFLGQLINEDVMAMHNSHDIILLPSVSEGLPVVLVEAMKCGVIPMVTNLRSGIPELIAHSENGFLVKLDETSKYCEYILNLKNDMAMRQTMSKLCIDKANLNFDAYTQAKAYENAFATTETKSAKIPFKKRLIYYIPFRILKFLKK